MTEQELAAIEALAKAATPGPWFDDAGYRIHGPTEDEDKRAGEVLHHYKQMCYGDDGCQQSHDAAYIAAMHPPTTLALIAEIRRLQREMALNVALSNGQSESLIEAAFEAGYNKGKLGVGEFWPAARQTLQTLKQDGSYRDYR